MSVSIVMPCYNEAEIIESVVSDYYNEIISKIDDSEFLVVDDHSTDASYDILRRLESQFAKLKVLRTDKNSGHGKAVRLGYESAAKNWIFGMDSDNQFDVKDFWKLYNLKDNFDFMLGVRRFRRDPWLRLLITKSLCFVNLVFFGVWIKDPNCPFRLINKELLKNLLDRIDKQALAPNIMISILARLKNKKIAQVEVTHFKRKTGGSSLGQWKLFNFALRSFSQLIFLKISKKVGQYE